MRSFSTLVRSSLASVVLAAVPVAAHAGITSTTNWQLYNSSTCSTVSGTPGASAGCIGDGGSGATNGNEYKFSSTSQSGTSTGGNLLAAAFTLDHTQVKTDGKVAGLPDLTASLQKTFEGFYSGQDYGIGAENLGSPQHSVDNSKYTDFIVIELPTGANTVTIDLSAFDTQENLDYTVWWGNPTGALKTQIGATPTPAAFNNVPFSDLDTTAASAANGFNMITSTGLFDEVNCTAVNTGSGGHCTSADLGFADQITVSAPKNFTYVIVAASINPATAANTPYENSANLPTNYEVDDFKINQITAQISSTPPRGPRCTNLVVYTGKLTPCPEPASLAMFGVGILGLGMAYRRRKAVRAN